LLEYQVKNARFRNKAKMSQGEFSRKIQGKVVGVPSEKYLDERFHHEC